MNFNAPLITQLTEPTSRQMVQQIRTQAIARSSLPQTINTSYVYEGKGSQPLLLLHGFDSSVLEFRRLLPLLAAAHPTWAVDMLGFGFTERPPRLNITPREIKNHLYQFWQALIQQPMILVGASMGGAAAIDFALTYPQIVDKLVLIDSAGFTAGPTLGKFLIPPLGWLATSFLKSARVRRTISRNAYHEPNLASQDAQICAALHLEMPGWRQALISFTQSGGYGSFQQRLPELQMPTLILWGESDQILGTRDAQALQQVIPNSQLIWIPACGHVPHLECPQQTATAISTWLEKF